MSVNYTLVFALGSTLLTTGCIAHAQPRVTIYDDYPVRSVYPYSPPVQYVAPHHRPSVQYVTPYYPPSYQHHHEHHHNRDRSHRQHEHYDRRN